MKTNETDLHRQLLALGLRALADNLDDFLPAQTHVVNSAFSSGNPRFLAIVNILETGP